MKTISSTWSLRTNKDEAILVQSQSRAEGAVRGGYLDVDGVQRKAQPGSGGPEPLAVAADAGDCRAGIFSGRNLRLAMEPAAAGPGYPTPVTAGLGPYDDRDAVQCRDPGGRRWRPGQGLLHHPRRFGPEIRCRDHPSDGPRGWADWTAFPGRGDGDREFAGDSAQRRHAQPGDAHHRRNAWRPCVAVRRCVRGRAAFRMG